jgi:type IV pilus assembly protein PilM
MEQLRLLEAQETTQPQVMEAIDNALYEVANEIAHSLDFYAASSTHGACEQVYISGGSGHVTPLIDALSQRVGVSVERLNPFRKMAPGDISAAALEGVMASASIAVGLAMRHMGDIP